MLENVRGFGGNVDNVFLANCLILVPAALISGISVLL